jgi:hypothetical protein
MNKADFAELVFGFVYAVGTDADPVITVLKNYLKQYRYDAEEFLISDQLRCDAISLMAMTANTRHPRRVCTCLIAGDRRMTKNDRPQKREMPT